MNAMRTFNGAEYWRGVFAHDLPPSALGTRVMAPRKREFTTLRQQFVPIKTKECPL